MPGEMEKAFLFALAATIAVESAALLILLKLALKTDINSGRIVFVGTLASSLTLPYVWFIFPAFIRNMASYHMISELFVVLIEAILFAKLLKIGYRKAGLVSFISNMASYGLTFVIHI